MAFPSRISLCGCSLGGELRSAPGDSRQNLVEFPLQEKVVDLAVPGSLGSDGGAMSHGRLPGGGRAPLRQVRGEPHAEASAEPPLLPAEPPALVAAGCDGHCHQLLFAVPAAAFGTAGGVGECFRVASNGAGRSRSSARLGPCVA